MSIEKSFAGISYRGSFRDYQRHLLRKLEERLDERKLNIVTPPGSGKVALGLEIVRRIKAPCLVISTTDITRSRWGDCFVSSFLPDELRGQRGQYVSYDLKNPALLTSVTYETLHAAFTKSDVTEDGHRISYADTDIIRLLQDCGIRTVLLDEPHHLNSHWMDSLESFLGVLGGEFHVVTLVHTPPYDLHSDEWERYVSLCGEISEEIHIPELVKGQALCPHQDYVYFNYPTKEESAGILGYRTRVDEAVAEAVTLPFMAELGRRLAKMYNRKKTDFLYNHHEGVVGILEMLHEYGYRVDMGMYAHLTGRKTVSPLTAEAAQHAVNLLLESQTLLRDGEKEQLKTLFADYRVMEHGYVQLALTPKVRRTLVSSVGKLDSIISITHAEHQKMGDSLREVILTDPMADEELERIGTYADPQHVSTSSVFDVLIQRLPVVPVGCLTPSCAILPMALSARLKAYGVKEGEVTVKAISNTGHACYTFADQTRKMSLVGRLFKDGHIRLLVGSADLLGEGWDDSFVNTLIVAAFNTSVVEINAVRGRVIHAGKEESRKNAHIWHLVTMERAYSLADNPKLKLASRLTSESDGGLAVDFRSLSRRFECYMGPNFASGELENGIDRLGLQSVSHTDNIDSINQVMLDKVSHRDELNGVWQTAMEDTTSPIPEVRVPKEAKVPVFTPGNTLLLLLSLVGLFAGLYGIYFMFMALVVYVFFNQGLVVTLAVVMVIIFLVLIIIAVVFSILYLLYILPLLISHLSTALSVRSLARGLFKTLKDIGEISKNAVLIMETLPDRKGYRLYVDNCNPDEQITFQKSAAELFSPIREPRYILVRGGWFHKLFWRWSVACPSVIARSDVWVKVFEKHIRRSLGIMKFQYTRRDPGRKYLIFARNKSYLNMRNKPCEKRIHLLKSERNL